MLADGRRVIDQEWVQLAPGPGVGPGRIPEAPQLEGGLGGRQGPQPGGRVGHQGLRQRVRPGGLPVLGEIVGQAGYLAEGSPGAVLGGHGSSSGPASQTIFTFGGGTNEIQRDIISWLGLGLPEGAALTGASAIGPATRTPGPMP